MVWTKGSQSQRKLGIAVCRFRKGDIAQAIDLNICDRVVIEQQCEGWYKGYLLDNRSVSGIFPSAYVHIQQTNWLPTSSKKRESQLELDSEDKLVVQELTETLKEWHKAMKKLFVNPAQEMMIVLAGIQKETDKLLELRASFTSPFLTSSLRSQLCTEITNKIDWGNKKLGLDVVPRLEGMKVGPTSMSAVQLYQIHMDTVRFNTGASTLLSRKRSTKSFNSHHMYLQLKSLSTGSQATDSDLAIYFSIYNYNGGSAEFISERVMCKMGKGGSILGVEAGQYFTAMFVDLTTADLNLEDAYLTAHIYKVGGLKNSKSDNSVITYKRPFACAALALREVLHSHHQGSNDDEDFTTDFSMPLILTGGKDENFSTITDYLIKKIKEKKMEDKEVGLVNVALGMFHGEMSAVRQEHSQLFTKNMVITQKLGFADVIAPDEVRNDFYLNLFEAEFEKGGKKADRNIEAKVLVVDSKGKELACISADASGEPFSHYETAVFYHSNRPRWNEGIKIVLSERSFHECHIRIEFRHCSNNAAEKKLFAFSYIPLEDSIGTTVQDRLHKLYIYKPSKSESVCSSKDTTPHYLNLAFEADNSGSTGGISNQYCSLSNKESFLVRTILCSTKLTQDVNLVNFFKWADKVDQLDKVLLNVQKVKGDELMRHHTDFLNSLFQMTCDVVASQHRTLIFQALIHILKFTKQKNYQQFLPVIESYIEKSFCAPLVHRELLAQIQLVLESQDAQQDQLLDYVIDVLDLLFKFIVRSAYLLAEKREDTAHDLLSKGMENFWKALQKLVRSTGKNVSKMSIISRVVDVFPELLKLLPPEQLATSFSLTIRAIPKRDSDFGEHKLRCLSKLINSPLFDHEGSRQIVLEVCNSQLLHCLQHQQDLKLVAQNLSDLLAAIHKHKGKMKKEIELVVVKLMRVLTISIMEEPAEVGLLTACLITMLSMMDETLLTKVLQEEKEEKNIKRFCRDMIDILTNTMSWSSIPSDWVVLLMLFNSVILSTAKNLSYSLAEYFLSDSNFNELVSQNYFMLCVKFITQPCLQLETFSESKRMTLNSWYPDMRVEMGDLLFDMWQQLDSYGNAQSVFIPSMIGPFLQVALVPESQLRTTTIPVFYEMLMSNFDKVHGEIVDRLDEYYISGQGDRSFKFAFSERLGDAASTDSSGKKDQILRYVGSVSTLIDHLDDYRSELRSDMSGKGDTLMLSTLNLLEFYQNEILRPKLYTHYVYKLRDLHLKQGFHTEAGFTLLLNASQLEWTDSHMLQDANCPPQREWERKEKHYIDIISYFDKGQSWENAIPLCKELASFYETKLYDFVKLQSILRQQAALFNKIVPGDPDSPRLECKYYRIAFYGESLPHCVRNKSFVYRTNAFTGLNDVIQQLKMGYPNATMLPDPIKTPNMDQLNPNKQYIQAVQVEPNAESTHQFEGALGSVDLKIANYYKWNDIKGFTYDQGFHSPTHDKDNEHRTLHKLRYTMTTVRAMPGILHWCEIKSMSQHTLVPLEVALESMTRKNTSMRQIIMRYKNNRMLDQNDLSMSLNGTIDAKVNGGIPMYQRAFFNPEYGVEHPEHSDLLNEFKVCLHQHLVIIHDGLNLFGEIAKPDLRPLMKLLSEEFSKLRAKVREMDPECEVESLLSIRSGSAVSTTDLGGSDSGRISSGYSSSDVEATSATKPVSDTYLNVSFDDDGKSSLGGKRARQDKPINKDRSSTFYQELPAVTIARDRIDEIKAEISSSEDEDEGTLKRDDNASPAPALPLKQRSASLSTQGSLISPITPRQDMTTRPLPAPPGVKRNQTFSTKGTIQQDVVYNTPRSPQPPRPQAKAVTLSRTTAPSTQAPVAQPRRAPPPLPKPRISSTCSDDEPPPLPKKPTSQTSKPPLLPPKSPKLTLGNSTDYS